MANSIYNIFGKSQPINDPAIAQIVNEVNNLRRNFRGDPRAEVENMLRSGRITQSQFNQYAQMANQIRAAMGNN